MMVRSAEVTYKIMSAVKSKNTKPEILLGQAMWAAGLRYRKHFKILGKPDFIFLKTKIAVFCDGDFWHGNNWKIRGLANFEEELEGYSPYWKEKIKKNIKRDHKVNKILSQEGWFIIRFWESEIKNAPEQCALKVKTIYDTSA